MSSGRAWCCCSTATAPTSSRRPSARAWEGCLREVDDVAPTRVVRAFLDSDPDRIAAVTGEEQIVGSDESTVMEWLTARVTLEGIESQHGRLWMLHACGLADPASGATVVLVAPSGTGKTTAARVLGRTFGYVSDETVAIGPDGAVVAYPKPLSLLEGGVRPKRQRSPRELGLVDAPRAAVAGRGGPARSSRPGGGLGRAGARGRLAPYGGGPARPRGADLRAATAS